MESIEDTILELKGEGLVIKIVEGLQNYLSCEMKLSDDKKRTWLGQPHLIKKTEKK